MGTFYVPEGSLRLVLGAAIDSAMANGPLDAAIGRLYQNQAVWSKATVLGDLTEATFDGYAEVNPITWANTPVGPGDVPYLSGGPEEIVCTGNTSPQTIYGWYIVDSGGTNLLGGYEFTDPIFMGDAGDVVRWTWLYMLNQVTLSLPGVCN